MIQAAVGANARFEAGLLQARSDFIRDLYFKQLIDDVVVGMIVELVNEAYNEGSVLYDHVCIVCL